MAVGAGETNAFNAQTAVTEAITIGVRVVRVGTDDALVGVGHAVVVVVLVLDEGVGLNARVRVVVGQLVGHTVAVKVLQNLEPERGFNREGRVGRVRPNRVSRVLHRLGWRSGNDAGRRVEQQAIRQVGRHFPRGAGYGVGWVDRRGLGVVHQDARTERVRAQGVGIRTGQTNRWNGVGAVADAITVRVGIEGIRTEIAGTVVDARARFRQVGCTVTVVVQVLDQLTVFGVVFGQFVGQTVTVGVFQDLQVEIKGDGRSIREARNSERCVVNDLRRCSADDTGNRVNAQPFRQVGRNTPCCAGQLIGRHKAAEQGVVHTKDKAFRWFTHGRGVRTGHTDGRHGVGAVADTVAVRIGVERVGAGVASVHVGARVRFVHVVQAVAVVVLVLHQRWNACGITVDGIGLAVAVRVGVG